MCNTSQQGCSLFLQTLSSGVIIPLVAIVAGLIFLSMLCFCLLFFYLPKPFVESFDTANESPLAVDLLNGKNTTRVHR